MDTQDQDPIYFYTRATPYWELSNFSPPGIEVDGRFWPTVEHYFQGQKFLDADAREQIRKAATPKLAKALGQSRSYPLRPGWDDLREEVMVTALRLKFAKGRAGDLLLSTGTRHLAEASPSDYFWGIGQDGTGLNKLGYLLMQVRDELRTAR